MTGTREAVRQPLGQLHLQRMVRRVAQQSSAVPRGRNYTWAELMKRVWATPNTVHLTHEMNFLATDYAD